MTGKVLIDTSLEIDPIDVLEDVSSASDVSAAIRIVGVQGRGRIEAANARVADGLVLSMSRNESDRLFEDGFMRGEGVRTSESIVVMPG